jgi:Tfp pilus assembly protein PilO
MRISKISTSTYIFTCVAVAVGQCALFYMILFAPTLNYLQRITLEDSELADKVTQREVAVKELQSIQERLLRYEGVSDAKNVEASKSFRHALILDRIDRVAKITGIRLGPLSAISQLKSGEESLVLSISGSYRAITDFVAELSYDQSVIKISRVEVNGASDWSYPNGAGLEAKIAFG